VTGTLRIVLLTTDTPHHWYWAQQVAAGHAVQGVFLEAPAPPPPFPTAHPFEAARDEYERQVLLGGRLARWTDIAEVHAVSSMNDAASLAALTSLRPDVILVFGTGRLAASIPSTASTACLNLHGGNPEHYRGLDTHLWAIYHGDFDNLVTTLHHVDAGLDTGGIVFQTQVQLAAGMRLAEFRAANTRACVDLTRLAIDTLDRGAELPVRIQTAKGRYYSAMPAVLKDDCVRKFERHAPAR
jgi:methionyl-tRNA formyltransferase